MTMLPGLVCLLLIATCEAQLPSPLNNVEPFSKIALMTSLQRKFFSELNETEVSEKASNLLTNIFTWANKSASSGNSSQCVSSLVRLSADILNRDPYTGKVIDSLGKPESGIMLGNYKWLGSYSECLDTVTDDFQGKWCSFTVGKENPLIHEILGLTVGFCVPDTCSKEALDYPLSLIINISHLDVKMEVDCPIQPSQWEATDIIFVIIASGLLAVLIFGTYLDFYYEKKSETPISEAPIDDVDVLTEFSSLKPPAHPALTEAVLSFSILKNTRNLLNVEKRPGTIDCLHGLRFISMSWVILGHSYAFLLQNVDNIVDIVDEMTHHLSFQAIANAFFAVDSFFFIGGLLVAYLSLKDQNRLTVNRVPMTYLQRYIRLTPVYAVVILFSMGLYGKLGSGPMWPVSFQTSCDACKKYWWTNLLYINNLHPSLLIDSCLAVGWYLGNDMQFFLLAPLSLLIYKRRKWIGLGVLGFGVVSSMIVTGVISTHYKLQPLPVMAAILIGGAVSPSGHNSSNFELVPDMTAADTFWSDTYAKPWCRIGIYLIGMMTGCILASTKCSIKMTRTIAVLGWVAAAVLNLSLLYGLWWYVHNVQPMTVSLASFYDAVSRPLWGVGLAWVVIACACGYGGPINAFLSWKLFIPLSRLTYCTYLTHPLVISVLVSTMEVGIHYSATQNAFFFVGILGISLAVGYVFSMLVEMPFVNLIKAITKQRERKRIPLVNEPAEDQ